MQALGRILQERPVLTNTIIYGILYSGAELFQQTVNRTILVRTLPIFSISKELERNMHNVVYHVSHASCNTLTLVLI